MITIKKIFVAEKITLNNLELWNLLYNLNFHYLMRDDSSIILEI